VGETMDWTQDTRLVRASRPEAGPD
jgi:hypothetical protein